MHKSALWATWLAATHGATLRRNMLLVDSVEASDIAAQGWTLHRTPESDQFITLQIGIKLKGEDELISKLNDVSDPGSKRYGQWLSREEANKIAQPDQDAANEVKRWLNDAGVETFHSSGDGQWVTFHTSVEKANSLLAANFKEFEKDGTTKLRTTEYSIPTRFAKHIDLIHPTTFFGATQPHRAIDSTRVERRQKPVEKVIDASCKRMLTPQCLRQLYNVKYTPFPNSRSRIGFGSFLRQNTRENDTKMYKDMFQLHGNVTKVNINTANNDQYMEKDHGEANLDAQCQLAITNSLPMTEYLMGGSPPIVSDLEAGGKNENSNEPYVPFYQYLLSKSNEQLPQAISISYGEPEHTVPHNYAQRTCLMIAMLGLRGITVLHSSGDTGIGANCLSNDGSRKREFNPIFPATCPWVTSVGGTEDLDPEIAWRDSSGGFSNYFERPWYQRDAVNKFLNEKLSDETKKALQPYFDQNGRGFPDISAHSLSPPYMIFLNSRFGFSGGTSAAAPVWAGLAGLLNDARLQANKTSMGFINPWLYAHGRDFLLDVTGGASRGCDGNNHQTGKMIIGSGIIKGAQWSAREGWDPVTGLGVPDFEWMKVSAMNVAEKKD